MANIKPRHNSVRIFGNGIIYVKKNAEQSEHTIRELYIKINKISEQLRRQGKPVLILVDARNQGVTSNSGWKEGGAVAVTLDFDKSATYGASEEIVNLRENKIKSIEKPEVRSKVKNFKTKSEALQWLLAKTKTKS